MIANRVQQKMFTRDQFLNKTYIKFDMKNFKLFDLTKFANAVDKLFAVGGLSINDVIERLGGELIDEEWANERYVTKNYERARISGTMEGVKMMEMEKIQPKFLMMENQENSKKLLLICMELLALVGGAILTLKDS